MRALARAHERELVRAEIARDDEIEPGEPRSAGRDALARQIVGRRDGVERNEADQPREQRRDGIETGPQRQIEAFAAQIDPPVFQSEIDDHVGTGVAIVGERPGEARVGAPVRRGDLQAPARRRGVLLDRCVGGVENVERLPALGVIKLARFGRAEMAARTIEQTRAGLAFELGDVLARHRRR